ncbi:hypothetical protein [Halobacillus naozhouensis]|uniref:YfzA-like protein n=1 Tax=Halobacillus naozhouensis TaxID=554880 RepID=A0ABY8IXC6_9BACI|nr:hypothetical protein [Halobacillus naozhouensis]WFT74482.1 hypothetical protein P9989_19350 [Halobacillus naozhouensis]
MKAEQWLKWILYLLVSIILLGLLDLVFQQAFSNMMGPPRGMGLANSIFLGFIDFFFYSLIIILALVILLGVFVFSVEFVYRLFTKE